MCLKPTSNIIEILYIGGWFRAQNPKNYFVPETNLQYTIGGWFRAQNPKNYLVPEINLQYTIGGWFRAQNPKNYFSLCYENDLLLVLPGMVTT